MSPRDLQTLATLPVGGCVSLAAPTEKPSPETTWRRISLDRYRCDGDPYDTTARDLFYARVAVDPAGRRVVVGDVSAHGDAIYHLGGSYGATVAVPLSTLSFR